MSKGIGSIPNVCEFYNWEDHAADFDGTEVHGVVNLNDYSEIDTKGTCCEVDDEADPPHFYSVYAHLKEGGLECIADLTSQQAAEEYAAKAEDIIRQANGAIALYVVSCRYGCDLEQPLVRRSFEEAAEAAREYAHEVLVSNYTEEERCELEIVERGDDPDSWEMHIDDGGDWYEWRIDKVLLDPEKGE